MTDKLAEAIAYLTENNDRGTVVDMHIETLIKNASKYHALPVVDVVRNNCAAGCLDYLRATYPDGLRWAK